MHNSMQHDLIQGQGHEPFRVGNLAIFKRCLRFLIYVLVSVSCDFELGRNMSCEESTISPIQG